MKFLVIIVWLTALGLPWFHTRPKPVFYDPSPSAPPVVQRRVAWHGPAKKSSPPSNNPLNDVRDVKSRFSVKPEIVR